MEPTRSVVFVCLHGSAKSLIATEYFRRLALQRGLDICAISAGTHSDLEIPHNVIEGLLKDRIDVRGRVPRQATREVLTKAFRVVSFGCDLGDMAPPGLAVERWDDVPAVSEDFSAARDVIVSHVHRLLPECEDSPNSSSRK